MPLVPMGTGRERLNNIKRISKMKHNDALLSKIVRAQEALKAGKLTGHPVVKSQAPADEKATSSWGPMMRV